MSIDIVIRRERPDQPDVIELIEALDAYLATLYAPEANHLLDVQALLAPEVHFLVAREAATKDNGQPGRALGTAAYRRMPAEGETSHLPFGEVKRMMVLPTARGQGIALRLLQALEAGMREDGLAVALLETGLEQTEAVRLYERNGYTRRGLFGGYPDNGLSVFYEKRL